MVRYKFAIPGRTRWRSLYVPHYTISFGFCQHPLTAGLWTVPFRRDLIQKTIKSKETKCTRMIARPCLYALIFTFRSPTKPQTHYLHQALPAGCASRYALRRECGPSSGLACPPRCRTSSQLAFSLCGLLGKSLLTTWSTGTITLGSRCSCSSSDKKRLLSLYYVIAVYVLK